MSKGAAEARAQALTRAPAEAALANAMASAVPASAAPAATGSAGDPAGKSDVELGTEQMWIIHGRRYDLTGFMDAHPGGRLAIEMSRGRDCTEMFESYHALSDRPKAMMGKFLAADQARCPAPVFSWERTPFFDDLKAEVRAYFGRPVGDARRGAAPPLAAKAAGDADANADKEGQSAEAAAAAAAAAARPLMSHKETWGSWALLALFVAANAWAVHAWAHGNNWALLALPWAYWLGCSHMMHSGSHWALSSVPLVNHIGAYLGSFHISAHDWRHQHVIGHHSHVNIVDKDPDLEHFTHNPPDPTPGFRLAPGQTWRSKYTDWRHSMALQAFFTTLGPSLLNQWQYWSERAFFCVPFLHTTRTRVVMHVLGRVGVVAFMLLVPLLSPHVSWLQLVPFVALPLGLHGYIYYCFSQVSHASESCAHGDEAACVAREWAVHQVLHSVDYCPESRFHGTVSIGLNCQTIHHVFPGISCVHFPAVSRILARVAARHGVPYVVKRSLWEALKAHYRHVAGLNEASDNATAEEAALTKSGAMAAFDAFTLIAMRVPPILVVTPVLVVEAVLLAWWDFVSPPAGDAAQPSPFLRCCARMGVYAPLFYGLMPPASRDAARAYLRKQAEADTVEATRDAVEAAAEALQELRLRRRRARQARRDSKADSSEE